MVSWKMAGWQNGISWQNGKVINIQVDKLANFKMASWESWQNNKQRKWQADKTEAWTKLHSYKIVDKRVIINSMAS